MVCAFSLVGGVALAGVKAPQTTGAGSQTIGQFHIDFNGGDIEFEYDPRSAATIFHLRGGPGQVVNASSARYDMAAPSIDLTYDNKTRLVTAGKATGGVRVVVRDPDRRQVTTLTGDTATYRGASGANPPRIDVNGNVRSVLRDPLFDPNNPLVTTGSSGFVEFLDGGRIRVKLSGAAASGTPIEPASKKKP
jgi:hypothetical protein